MRPHPGMKDSTLSVVSPVTDIMSTAHIKVRKASESMPTDIVKSGHIFIKRPPTAMKIRIKTWQKRLLVLRDAPKCQNSRLEVYNTDKNWYERKTEHFIVELQNVSAIEEYNASKSYPYAFTLTRKGHSPLVFGVETEGELREWIVALKLLAGKANGVQRRSLPIEISPWERRHSANSALGDSERGSDSITPQADIFAMFYNHRDRCDRGHLVQILPTGPSKDNRLQGNYMMRVKDDQIALRRTTSTEDIISWPIVHILKFKSEEMGGTQIGDKITLEAGLSCEKAQGVFLFKSHSGRELVQSVRDAVKKISDERKSPDFDLDSLRPPKARLGKCESSPNISYGANPRTDRDDCKQSYSSSSGPADTSYLEVIPDDESAKSPASTNGSVDGDTGPYGTVTYGTVPYLEILPDDTPEKYHTTERTTAGRDGRPPLPNTARRRDHTHRKDSGFCESFEDSPRPSSHEFHKRRSASEGPPGTPPTPPPRPRHTMMTSISGVSSRPLPPLPASLP